MAIDYLALKTELAKPAYTGLSDVAAAAAINAATVAGEGAVSGPTIGQLWARRGVLGAAYERANRAALTTAQRAKAWQAISMVQQDGFSGLDPNNAAQRTQLVTFLDELVTDTIMTAADKTATLALLAKTQPLAATFGFTGPVSYTDVAIARAS